MIKKSLKSQTEPKWEVMTRTNNNKNAKPKRRAEKTRKAEKAQGKDRGWCGRQSCGNGREREREGGRGGPMPRGLQLVGAEGYFLGPKTPSGKLSQPVAARERQIFFYYTIVCLEPWGGVTSLGLEKCPFPVYL